jgi:hypothetical protein
VPFIASFPCFLDHSCPFRVLQRRKNSNRAKNLFETRLSNCCCASVEKAEKTNSETGWMWVSSTEVTTCQHRQKMEQPRPTRPAYIDPNQILFHISVALESAVATDPLFCIKFYRFFQLTV